MNWLYFEFFLPVDFIFFKPLDGKKVQKRKLEKEQSFTMEIKRNSIEKIHGIFKTVEDFTT